MILFFTFKLIKKMLISKNTPFKNWFLKVSGESKNSNFQKKLEKFDDD